MFTTLLDIQMKSGVAKDKVIVDNVLMAVPELKRLPAHTIPGTSYTYRVRNYAPRLGFRPANAGIGIHKTSYELKNDSCYILQAMIGVDRMVAAADPDGWQSVLAEEVESHMQGITLSIGSQLYYGKALDPDGFSGYTEAIGDYMTLSADAERNADNAANQKYNKGTSAWFVVEDPKMLRLEFGNSQGISFGPVRESDLAVKDKDGNMATMPAKVQDVGAWLGLSVRSEFALARIKNIDAEHPLTDELLAEALSFFPAGVRPSALYVNPFARRLLQQSRSKRMTNINGQQETTTAPLPTEYEGIPIVCTDAILNDESAESVAKLAKLTEYRTPKVATLRK
ncbi:hypothetical protein ICN84_11205 [Akkermansia glycaniphila]|uniref:major capsid protein n=1 Tax=Akkermansia glycaniphila TaxID=1679444 RepID=UPI001C032416|nr:hypothetical protein [Akkermansia glycaniphila]MBT9450634.1 hypothetical protein [Akkermansia glycaniphila]